MRSETTPRGAVAALIGVALAALGLSACRGGPSQKQGGDLTFVAKSYPDHLDPQLGSSVEALQAEYNTYIPLLTFRHESGRDGSDVVPGLAKDLPAVSEDGRTYTLDLQTGLRYSDGTPVEPTDFEAGVERLFDLDSRATSLYEGIVGTSEYAEGTARSISGIEADDATGGITIRLRRPDGEFEAKLAMPFAAPIPSDTPATDQTTDPPPATGPYVIADSDPGKRFVLERNPEWARSNEGLVPDVPTPYADRITEKVIEDPSTQTTQVMRNRADFMVDPPPPDRIPEIVLRYPDRFQAEPTLSAYYFWMNTAEPPFDDLRVRQAVNRAVDLKNLKRIYGTLMFTSQQVLPPGMPGYGKVVVYPHDFGEARELIQEADPSDLGVTVWAVDRGPDRRAAAYLESLLERLGFEANLKTVDRSRYLVTIGNSKTPNLDAGIGYRDATVPHPNQLFGPLLNGRAIRNTHNTNFARFDDGTLSAEMDRLATEPLDSDTEDDYKGLDRDVMEQAPWAPFGSREVATFTSDRIDTEEVIFNPVMHQDFGSFAVE
jgi:peptide/nickel transport system substrate-binding protein